MNVAVLFSAAASSPQTYVSSGTLKQAELAANAAWREPCLRVHFTDRWKHLDERYAVTLRQTVRGPVPIHPADFPAIWDRTHTRLTTGEGVCDTATFGGRKVDRARASSPDAEDQVLDDRELTTILDRYEQAMVRLEAAKPR